MTGAKQPGPSDELTALYRDTIVKHAVHPVGFEAEIHPTHSHQLFNPLCGDRVELMLRVAGDDIEAMAFKGEACAICLASASLLCERQPGHTVESLRQAGNWLEESLNGQEVEPGYEHYLPLLGVRAFPSRVRCVLLPWEAALEALDRD